jgi:hypothetical protein
MEPLQGSGYPERGFFLYFLCTAVPLHLSLFPVKLFTFAKTGFMINNEQIKDLSERRDALRRYL